MFRRAIPTALAVALSLFCVVGPTSALADDPVDDCAADVTTTCALTSPTFTTSGSLGQNGDMDWIRFTAPQNGAWLFTVESGNMRVVAQLLKDYNPLVYAVQSGHITFGQSLAAGETVYVAIYAQWGESGPYTVHAALGATIAGTVTPNNVPLPEPGTYTHTEAYVCPVTNDVVGSCLNVRSTNPWAPPTSTWSAVVEPGKKYVVYASVDGYLRTYLGGRTESPYVDPVRTPSAVSGVTVVTAPAVGGTLSNQSITLALAASISGTVTVPSGHTLIEDYGDAGQVTAFAPVALPGGSTALTRWGAVSIEADGHYALDSVAAGAQYAICVSRVNSSPNDLIRSCAGGGRAPSVFEGVAVPPADLAALTWVTAPSAGATTTGVNIALQAAAHIKGTVSLPGGLALPTDDWGGVAGSMDVYKVGADGTLSSGDCDACSNPHISFQPNGTYDILVAPGSSYVVVAHVEGYLSTYYGQYVGLKPTIPATGVTVVSGLTNGQTVSGVNITMKRGSSISGTLTPARSDGWSYGTVEACPVSEFNKPDTSGYYFCDEAVVASVDSSGHYVLGPVVPGVNYVVIGQGLSSVPTFYGGFAQNPRPSLPHAGVTIVTAASVGGTVSGVNITLAQMGTITGTVLPFSVINAGIATYGFATVTAFPVFTAAGQTYFRNTFALGPRGGAYAPVWPESAGNDQPPRPVSTFVAADGSFTLDVSPDWDYVFVVHLEGQTDAWHGGYSGNNDWVANVGYDWDAPYPTLLPNGPIMVVHPVAGQTVSGVDIVFGGTPGSMSIGPLSVSGGSSVGSVLTASVPTVFPSNATKSYQWLRAGQPIAGATKSTYTLTTKDMCLQLSVRVTVSKSGYTSVSKTSAAKTGPVFTDVPSSHTFYSAICWVAQTGVTVGTGGGMYSPSDPVNRGSMAAFLYRMAGSPTWTPPATSPFTDVPKSHKFYKEITWLAASGITVGVVIGGKTYYEPDNAVTRGSMSAFMYRLSGSPSYTAPATAKFADVGTAHTFYKTISWLASKNITAGTMVGGQLLYQPSNPVNRGSMAAFLNRLANQHLQCTKYPNGIQCGTG